MHPESVFHIALAYTLAHEGGYVNNPHDPGGDTNFGISRRSYPDMDIRGMTQAQAAAIYRIDFWIAPGFDTLAFAPDLAIKAFDLGVNCGPKTAVKFLQRAVNTVCAGIAAPERAGKWQRAVARILGGDTLRVDGILGPITLNVIKECPWDAALMAALKGEAYKHYQSLAEPAFIAGWLTRLEG